MKHLFFLLLMFLSLGTQAQTVTNTVTLDGSGSSDPDGTIASYLWTKVGGTTGGDVMTNVTSAKATVVYTLPGEYTYKLTVTDNQGATAFDTVHISVLAPNKPPKANAGSDIIIQLPPANTTSYNEVQIPGSPLQAVRQNSKVLVAQIRREIPQRTLKTF